MLKPGRPPVHDEFAALRGADDEALCAARELLRRVVLRARDTLAAAPDVCAALWAAFLADAAPVAREAWREAELARRGVAAGLTGVALATAAASVAAPGVLMLAAAVALVRPAAPQPQAPTPGTLPDYVRFIDRFGRVDGERWIVSDGWHNGEWVHNDWRASALRPGPDGLAIVMSRNEPGAAKPLSAGELQSQELYRYGYFEVRMRVPRGEGTGIGFFTFTRPEGTASWQEIDVEIVGSNTRAVELTYHRAGRSRSERLYLPFDAAEGLHTYAFEWTREGVRWYIDNEFAHEEIGGGAELLTSPQRLYLSLWGTRIEAWAGRIDFAQAPWTLEVTCVAQAREYRGVSLCAD